MWYRRPMRRVWIGLAGIGFAAGCGRTTVVAAGRVARKTKAPALHGTLVGVIAATAALLPAWPIDLRDIAITIAVIGAGWLAGALSGSE